MKPKRSPRHTAAPVADPEERQRLFRTFGIATALAVVVAIFVVIYQGPKRLTESDRASMREYEQIRIALARDDLVSAKSAAAAMIHSGSRTDQFHDSAVVITQSDSLAETRSAFARISERALQLVKGNAGFFVVGCAMDRCPVKCSPCHMQDYADWVQVDANVENPFMGKSSPHCGIIKASY
jgi:hypothetical protein